MFDVGIQIPIAFTAPWRFEVHARNVSRLIDLDLLYLGGMEIETIELRLPHPRMTEREFVLRPLADIRPDLVFPNQTESVSQLLSRIPDTGVVVRIAVEW